MSFINDITELYEYNDDYIIRETMVNKTFSYNDYYKNVMNAVFSELNSKVSDNERKSYSNKYTFNFTTKKLRSISSC